MNFLATCLQTVNGLCLYADLRGYKTPSIITGDIYRPDLLLQTSNKCLYIVQLTVGFESNLQKNSERKESKCAQLIREQSEHFKFVKFVNISTNVMARLYVVFSQS